MTHPPNAGSGTIRRHHTEPAVVLRLLDALLIAGTLPALFFLMQPGNGPPWTDAFSLAAVGAVGLFFFFAEMNGLYRSWRGVPLMEECARVCLAWMGVMFGLLLIAYATKSSEVYSRRAVLTWFFVAPTLVCGGRIAAAMALRHLRSRGRNMRAIGIIGRGPAAELLIRRIEDAPWLGMRIVGIYDDREVPGAGPAAGSVEDLVALARVSGVDHVFVTLPTHDTDGIQRCIAAFADTTSSLYIVPDAFVAELFQAGWVNLHGVPVVGVFESPFEGASGWLKRAEDVIVGSMILLVVAVPMLIVALGVKLTSPGPVLFRQRRYGLDGREILVWKFRSMSVVEDGGQITQATKNDARVTRFGAFLRRTSLDELPQFFNVLGGSMSIVGPRPHAVMHNEQFRKVIHAYMQRHKVKPGITGLAQVNGWRGETDTTEKMQRRVDHDLEYIRTWSVWLDLKIIALTIVRGFTGKNAY